MTPQFALVLSVGGVRLLKRAASGWVVFGSAPLDSKDLSQRLTKMREDAQAELGSDARLPVKLVLPNDQIRYLKLDQPDAQEDDVRAALDAATSYDVDELRYDFEQGETGTQVAAVALEALLEAEEFARDNAFLPLGFTAAAPDGTFEREVFFGVTREGRAVWLTAGPEDAPVREGEGTIAGAEVEGADNEPGIARDALAPGAAAVLASDADAEAEKTGAGSHDAPPQSEEEAAVSTTPAENPTPAAAADTRDTATPGADPFSDGPAEKRRSPLLIAGVLIALLLVALLAWVLLRDRADVQPVASAPVAPLVDEPLVINADEDPTAPTEPAATEPAATEPVEAQDVPAEVTSAPETAAPAPETPEEPVVEAEAAPQQAATTPAPEAPDVRQVLSRDEALRNYAATGVWQRAPQRPTQPAASAQPLDLPAPLSSSVEAERPAAPDPDIGLQREASPANPDQPRPEPAIATEEASDYAGPPIAIPPARPGSAASVAAVTPNADTQETDTSADATVPAPVFASAPDVAIPARPATPDAETTGAPEVTTPDSAAQATPDEDASEAPQVASLSPTDLRPAPRPPVEAPSSAETAPAEADSASASFDGARPTARPAVPTSEPAQTPETAEPETTEAPEPVDPFATATSLAVASAERPASQRPSGFSRTVERARAQAAAARARAQAARAERAAAAQRNQPAQASAPAAATVQIVRPSAASAPAASNAATQEDAIDLSRISLIGVFGAPRDRRAHVRLANGQIVVVRAGDSLDGGRVAAIEKNTVTYTRSGQTVRLPMPGG